MSDLQDYVTRMRRAMEALQGTAMRSTEVARAIRRGAWDDAARITVECTERMDAVRNSVTGADPPPSVVAAHNLVFQAVNLETLALDIQRQGIVRQEKTTIRQGTDMSDRVGALLEQATNMFRLTLE